MAVLELLIPVLALVVLAVLVLSRRGRAEAFSIDSSLLPAAQSVSSRIRLRNVGALLSAFIIGGGLVNYGVTVPNDHGRSLLVAPLITAVVAIAFFVIIPAFPDTGDVRSADLSPRTPLALARRSTMVIATFFGAALLAMVLIWGLVAESDGRSIGNDFGTLLYTSTASPFPGFYYGIPIALGVAVLLGVVVIAISRLTAARAPIDKGLLEVDLVARRLAIDVIVRIAAAGAAMTLAFGLVIAGQSTASVSSMVVSDGAGGTELIKTEAMRVFAVIEGISAFVFFGAAIILAVTAIVLAVRRPFDARSSAADS